MQTKISGQSKRFHCDVTAEMRTVEMKFRQNNFVGFGTVAAIYFQKNDK
jgi:hypothetical protein